jgi:uncharacterized protein YndB with AHSA1/START domain
MRSTKVSRHIASPRDVVFAAVLDQARWKFPAGMTCEVHELELREGGAIRISLTYEDADATGKSSAHTDTYRGRFVEIVPDERVVEVDEFETNDPTLRGEMRATITLADTDDGGTLVTGLHEGVPPGVSLADNELGWSSAFERLAALVEP